MEKSELSVYEIKALDALTSLEEAGAITDGKGGSRPVNDRDRTGWAVDALVYALLDIALAIRERG